MELSLIHIYPIFILEFKFYYSLRLGSNISNTPAKYCFSSFISFHCFSDVILLFSTVVLTLKFVHPLLYLPTTFSIFSVFLVSSSVVCNRYIYYVSSRYCNYLPIIFNYFYKSKRVKHLSSVLRTT